MNKTALDIIYILQILLIVLLIGAPLTGSNYLMMLQIVFIPFILIHWVTGRTECALVFMEKGINKIAYNESIDTDECYTGRLVKPIYTFNSSHSKIIYLIMFILLIMSVAQLYMKYQTGSIQTWQELFRL